MHQILPYIITCFHCLLIEVDHCTKYPHYNPWSRNLPFMSWSQQGWSYFYKQNGARATIWRGREELRMTWIIKIDIDEVDDDVNNLSHINLVRWVIVEVDGGCGILQSNFSNGMTSCMDDGGWWISFLSSPGMSNLTCGTK